MSTLTTNVAIISSRQADLVDLIRKSLRQLNIMEVISCSEEAETISRLNSNIDAALILDWGLGEGVCTRILESMQTSHPAGVRPIFVLSRVEDAVLKGVALEFGVMQIHSGPVSRDLFDNKLKKLLSTQTYNRDIRDALNASIDARRRNDTEQEVAILHSIQSRYRKDVFLVCELAEAYMRYDRLEDAVKIVAPLIDQNQKNPRLLNIHGRCLLKKGMFDQATVSLQQADLINPFNVSRLLNLADAYLQMDNPQRAKANFHKALTMDPTNRAAAIGMGKALLLLGDVNDALGFLRQISDASEMASVFNVAAVIAIRNGRKDDGLKLYRIACKTVGIKERDVLAKLAFNMGLAHFRASELAPALYYFEISNKLNSSYERGAISFDNLQKRVPDSERIPIEEDLFTALTKDIISKDLLGGEDFEFRRKVADYDMEF